MKKYFYAATALLMAALCSSGALYAQDIITLKSGEDIKAKVLEITTTEVKYKKFDNLQGPIYTVQKATIFMVNYENGDRDVFKEETPAQVQNLTRQPAGTYDTFRKSEHPTNYAAAIQLGYGFGGGYGSYIDEYDITRFNLNFINGYKFSPYFTLGFGVGLNIYTMDYVDREDGRSYTVEDFTMPLSLYLHTNFTQGKVSPFISFSGGYNIFMSGDAFFAGLILEPTFGVSFKMTNKTRFSISLSYTWDQMQYHYYETSYDYYGNPAITFRTPTYTVYPGAINFKIGILNF